MASGFDRLLHWFTRRPAAPASVAAPVAPPDRAPRRRVEFPVFQKYLESRYADVAVLTFGQIEDLLGAALPAIALTRASWWSEVDDEGARYAMAWKAAGRTALSNPGARHVTFARI